MSPLAMPAPTGGIVAYWRSLIGAGSMPPASALDRGHIDETWPRTLLLSCRWDRDGLKLDVVYSRLWVDGTAPQFDDETCREFFDTLVAHGLEVVETGRPVVASHRIGPVRLRLTALPLGNDGHLVDHVLCRIETLD